MHRTGKGTIMTRSTRFFYGWLIGSMSLCAYSASVTAQVAGAAGAAASAYKPPMRGAPASRVGGGSRGAGDDAPHVSVLAPDHTGLTTKEQPALYWFVSKPVAAKLEVTVINEQAVKPALEQELGAPAAAGIQRLRLADFNVKLQPGIEYRWHVSLVLDPRQRSNDIIASGTIQRVAPSAQLQARMQKLDRRESARVYAEEGIWYDAIEVISEAIEANPNDRAARRQRALLLQQVGLTEAGRYDSDAP